MRIFVLLSSLLFFPLVTFGQGLSYTIGGNVYDSDKQAIIGATVLLVKEGEVNTFKGTTASDSSFIFHEVPVGKYALKVSYLGYKEKSQPISVTDKDITDISVFLEQDTVNLSEIVITAKNIEMFADKTIFRPTSIDRNSFNNALTILQTIPKLQVMDLSLTTINGKEVKVLINGINSDATDLSVINSKDILRIEYYENPPARFAEAGLGAVVNIITKKVENGGIVALNLQNAIITGYGNNVASIKYNFDNSQVGLKYSIKYRDFNKRVLDENLEYQFDNIDYKKVKKGLNSPYQYEDQLLEISYNNQKPDNYVFSSKFSLKDYDSRKSAKQMITQYLPENLEGVGFSTDKTKNITPNLDLYFNKVFNSHEILANLVGTYFNTNYRYTYDETVNEQNTFNTYTHINGDKYSLIGDFQYIYSFGKHKISVGLKSLYGTSTQEMDVNSEVHTSSDNKEFTVYTELSGRLNKLSYKVSIGMDHSQFNSTTLNKSYSFTAPKPSVLLGFALAKNAEINLSYLINTINPTLAELSPSIYFIDNKFAYSGNPDLRPFNKHEFALSYFINKGNFLFSTEALINYAQNPILPFFKKDENYLLETLDNLNNSKYYSWNFYLQWFPLTSKILRFTLYSELSQASNEFSDITWKYDGYRVVPSIILNYHKWNLVAFYLSKLKTMLGQRLQTSPSAAGVELSYKPINNLTTTLAIRYPFYSAWNTYSETHPSALVHLYESEKIKNMGNMIYVGLVYNFSFGKVRNDIKQKINNEDKDSGVLNRTN